MTRLGDIAFRAAPFLRALAGWLAVHIAVGGLLGFIFVHQHAPFCLFCDGREPKPNCLPGLQLFGEIESRCRLAVVNGFWFVILGLPRLCISLPAIVILIAVDAMRSRDAGDMVALLGFGIASSGPIAVFILAYQYWCSRAPRAGALIGAMIGLDMLLYFRS